MKTTLLSTVVGLAAIASTPAFGSLIVDLRVMDGASPSATPKQVTVSSGSVVTLGLFATVSGNDSVATNDGLQSLYGSVLSTPASNGPVGNLSSVALASPFNGQFSTGGTVQDLNALPGLDVGGAANNNADGFIFPRSASMTLGTSASTGTTEFFLGTLQWTVSQATEVGDTSLNFIIRNTTSAAVWREDGTNRAPLTASFSAGSPVVASVIPEPASLALVGLASLAGLRRRIAR